MKTEMIKLILLGLKFVKYWTKNDSIVNENWMVFTPHL